MNKEFYTLTEVELLGLSTIKYRQLKKRMRTHLDNNTLFIGENLFRIGWSWQIHHTLLPHFQAKNTTQK